MSIRLQLLLVSLTTLILPWAGCQYAREVQTVLRASQEQSLLASAGTIANALSAQPQRLFHSGEAAGRFDARGGDVYAFPLRTTPLLDGYRDDWDIPQNPQALPSLSPAFAASLQAGVTERYLFLYIDVKDPHFDPQDGAAGPAASDARGYDRVEIALLSPEGTVENYFFATGAPGLIAAQSMVVGEDGRTSPTIEPRIQGFWLQTAGGYRLECRIPLTLVGARLWIEAIDGANETQHRAGTLRGADDMHGGRLFFSSGTLLDWLTPFIRNGTRATIIDANALKLATVGSAEASEPSTQETTHVGWYRRFQAIDTAQLPLRQSLPDRLDGGHVSAALMGHAQAQWFRTAAHNELLLAAAAPVIVNGETLGAVVLEQAGDQLLGLRDRSLSRLFNLTLVATGIVVACVLGFASWLSFRIGKLRKAADSAVMADGRIRVTMPDGGSQDEIGALSRSFSQMIARLGEHTQYLRTLGGKLSHELRTPLTIVKSSIDNLELEGVAAEQKVYVDRAREGAERLQSILGALGAAARVEESIQHAERVNFDLRALLEQTVAAYRDGFAPVRFRLLAPEGACPWRGAPELIVQMLDKLVENAVDFVTPSGEITVGLSRLSGHYHLRVGNDGQPIPEAMLGRLFESLFELRPAQDGRPHFGLGLSIVRLIAEFHGGTVSAANRPDGSGVEFTVDLPMI